jgi:prolyl oligopeptidase
MNGRDAMTQKIAPSPTIAAGDVVDNYFGSPVADPYRALEDGGAPETIAWAAAQNSRAEAYLRALPHRDRLGDELTRLWSYTECRAPERRRNRSFFFRRDPGQDHAVFYAQDDGGTPVAVIDPNRLSADGSVALTGHHVNHDGSMVAYSLSESGSKWTTLRVRMVGREDDESDVLPWTLFPSVAWEQDGSAFYYDRYPAPTDEPTKAQVQTGGIYRHRLGTAQAEDTLVFQPEIEGALCRAYASSDCGYLFIYASQGTDERNGIYVRPMASGDAVTPLAEPGEAAFALIDVSGDEAFLVTDLSAPRGRIVAVDLERPERERWREVVAESDGIIEASLGETFARIVGDRLVVPAVRNVQHEVRIFTLAGDAEGSIPLPSPGAVTETTGRPDSSEFYFNFASFLHPPTVMRYDVATTELAVSYRPEVPFDFEAYETEQVIYTSADGTRAPMYVTHRKGMALDQTSRALLYAYGGFSLSILPSFSASVLAWLQEGGVYAVATLRGGGEFGQAWHEAGMLGNKQNVFDDFIAAGEHLISAGYTSRAGLAINGRSNGGLLVASCLVQRPDLYGAVICEVPVIDMLRYHRFSSGIWWVGEYGQADTSEDHFRFLHAYSPLHNVRMGTCYPPTLVATAEGDDHVVPAHAFKFGAALQAAQSCDRPIILQVRSKIGHGGGTPVWKSIEEATDIFAFLLETTGAPRQGNQ